MPDTYPNCPETWAALKGLLAGGSFTEIRKRADEQGVFVWEVRTTADDGSTIEYQYIRAGTHEAGTSDETIINLIHLEQDIVVYTEVIAKFVGGEWVLV